MSQHKYMWVAILEDESVITEYNPDGSENSYKDIPRDRVKYLGLHSANSSYFMDVNTGVFHIKDHVMEKVVDIKLPIGHKFIPITGSLGAWNKYDFNQFKQATADFAGRQKRDENGELMWTVGPDGKRKPVVEYAQMGPTQIEKYLLTWNAFKQLPGVGPRYVTSTLVIDPNDSIRPVLKVELRMQPNTPPVQGSPYEIAL